MNIEGSDQKVSAEIIGMCGKVKNFLLELQIIFPDMKRSSKA